MVNSENIDKQTFTEEITLKELFLNPYSLKLLRYTYVVCVFLGGISGFIYSYKQKPDYTATTTFVLEDSFCISSSSLLKLPFIPVFFSSSTPGLFKEAPSTKDNAVNPPALFIISEILSSFL